MSLNTQTYVHLQLHILTFIMVLSSAKYRVLEDHNVHNTWLLNFPFILWKYQLQKCSNSDCSVILKHYICDWKTSLTTIQLPIFTFSDFICRWKLIHVSWTASSFFFFSLNHEIQSHLPNFQITEVVCCPQMEIMNIPKHRLRINLLFWFQFR